MFSRKLFIFVGVALFIAINFAVITMSSKETLPVSGAEPLFISITSPVQSTVSHCIHLVQDTWNTYFMAVLAVKENHALKKELGQSTEIKNRYEELELENVRLKKFVNFTSLSPSTSIAAQIIARDPSPWFKTIRIDKGSNHGLVKASLVLVS